MPVSPAPPNRRPNCLRQTLLNELLRFARYHAAFSIGSDARPALREPLARLRRLVDVPATIVMRLFDYHDNLSTLSIEQFKQAIGLVESYVFRRAICGMQTRNYWQVFANLSYRIDPERPFESLKVGLARLSDSYVFPSDEEFRQALEEGDIFHKRVCFDLLDRLENDGSKEATDTSTYSIEHIMPQNEKLSLPWKRMLGEDRWQEVQREWLHRLGNLTLTGYNSTLSDRPFEEKKTIPRGFSESSVRLNKFVREQKVWTSLEMGRRGIELAGRALEIWPNLVVDKKLIEQARVVEMRERAQRRDVTKVPMTPAARLLFDTLRATIKILDTDVIELAEQKSVSYHGPAFFLEVIPRKYAIGLLLPLDLGEIDDPYGIAQDTSQWKFLVNSVYDGGVYVHVQRESDVDKALPMIHLAREIASA
ncbi:MAG: HNH endonuclease family protein, partial [Ardenticatenales bacterium]